jgi:polyhydroxybutyrate depolymerase
MIRIVLLLGAFFAVAQAPAAGVEPQTVKMEVAGLPREALVYAPAKTGDDPAPLVFGFHGHGGRMASAATVFRLHELWPEAIVIYPQGVQTPGQITDFEGRRSGWQRTMGDQQDRDLKFVDALLAKAKKDFHVDEKRIYAMGHSNGGGFTYLLWQARPEVFAAYAPSGAAALRIASNLKPAPVLHIAGTNDPLVKYEWQFETIVTVCAVNGCPPPVRKAQADATGKPPELVVLPSEKGAPVATYTHDGGHQFTKEAPEVIVRFFKEHPRKEG